MNVSVFGLGYVGCVTAACLARDGHHVIGVDVNAEKVAMINAGSSPIIEPGLADLVSRVVRQGRLSATDSAEEGIAEADVALICVGTPDLGHGQPDYDGLARVASAIGAACESRTRPLTVVLRSTVLPGTTERVLARVLSECSGGGRMAEPLRIAVNPEFMREGVVDRRLRSSAVRPRRLRRSRYGDGAAPAVCGRRARRSCRRRCARQRWSSTCATRSTR